MDTHRRGWLKEPSKNGGGPGRRGVKGEETSPSWCSKHARASLKTRVGECSCFFRTPSRRPFLEGPSARLSSTYSILNPYTLTRIPPTQFILSGKVAPPPNFRGALMSFLQGADPLGGPRGGAKGTQGGPQRDPRGSQRTQGDPKGTKGPKGPKRTQGEPRGPKGPKGTQGTQGRLRRPWGMGPWGPLGLFRSHSEWKAISSRGFL